MGGGGNLETTLKNRPNLLIKGNNLIALHSLKEYFRHQSEQNKVKLIYIDPPYNTGSDSFNYNDRFNHSTYLTFMKNRLEIARELLRDDGVIFVQCDDNEQAYLKVLMDEIFGRENFVANIIRRVIEGGKQDSKQIQTIHDYILIYAKNINESSFNKIEQTDFEHYTKKDKYFAERGAYYLKPLENMGLGYVASLDYEIISPKGNKIYAGGKLGEPYRFVWSKDKFNEALKLDLIEFITNSKGEEKVYYKTYEKFSTKGEFIERKIPQSSIIMDMTNRASSKEIKFIFGEKAFNYSKPEALIKRIIEISTQENDLVLDFFAGSGTTLAVAHKMKRRYIGIEQMEYIESITKERLKKVIEGEQGGISKAVSWSGGGNLIYCELASLNAKFIEKIENSSDENELNQIYENLQKLAFIDYRVDIKNDLKDDEFSNLDFINKKRILKKCLDRNMDYIPYADIDDSEYKIDERAKKLNKIFYGENDG